MGQVLQGHVVRLRETNAKLSSGCWGRGADYLRGVKAPNCCHYHSSASLPVASTGLAHQAHFYNKGHTHPLAQSYVCTHVGERTCIHLAPTSKGVLRVGAEIATYG